MTHSRNTAQTVKSTLYLIAISIVMLVGLLLRPEAIPRDTNQIVEYLTSLADIPNSVTAVILGSRLFDTIGEVTVFTVAGIGVKILLTDEQSETKLLGIQDPVIISLLDSSAKQIAKCGMPCKKFTVPSIGSIIQVLFWSLFFLIPFSSLIIE